MKRVVVILAVAFALTTSTLAVTVPLTALPGQAFIHQESFDSDSPAGFNLSPSFVPYPQAPTWKTPGASEVVDGALTSSNKNGAAAFDMSGLFGPFGADLANESVALYMRLWTGAKSDSPRVTMGMMNFAAEQANPDQDLAQYVGIYVRNSNNAMVSWGAKSDMDNLADGTGLQKQGMDVEGWYDYAVLFEGDGSSITASAFQKSIEDSTWIPVANSEGETTIDTGVAFDSRQVYFWTRDNANIWQIDEFAVSQVPEPATVALLGLGGLALLRRRKNA